MFWQEDETAEADTPVSDAVVDLLFRIQGDELDIDHAGALADELQEHLPASVCERIAVIGVRLAESGNGWQRPEQGDAVLPLSRRARLGIRVRREDRDRLRELCGRSLRIGKQTLVIGDCRERPLSTMATQYARAIACDPTLAEVDFLGRMQSELRSLGLSANKMICGRSGEVRTGEAPLFTRALLIADLKPEEALLLQQTGLGKNQILGCGVFVAHKGIAPVAEATQADR